MQGSRILIVEDSRPAACQIQYDLEQLGYTVAATASSGEDAIALARRLDPDLVLMDVHLNGELDGIAAAQAVTAELDIPVVYLTVRTDKAFLERAEATDASGYIHKPCTPEELHANITLALYKWQADKQMRQGAWAGAAIASVADAVIALATDGAVRLLNPSAAALTGSSGECIGRHWASLLRLQGGLDNEGLERLIAETLHSGHSVYRDRNISLVDASGQAVPVSVQVKPYADRHGHCSGAILVIRDIAERRKVEQALHQRTALMHRAVTSAPIVLFTLDREGVFTLLEGECLHSLGLEPGQFVGRSAFDVYRHQPILADFHRALAGETLSTTHRVSGRIFEVQFSPMHDPDGRLAGAIGVATDVTERVSAEQGLAAAKRELERRVAARTQELHSVNRQLQAEVETRKLAEQRLKRAKEEAESANNAKSQFLSRMSHELRTPLNAIIGFAQLMEMDPALQEGQHQDNINEILLAGRHLLSLINEVLDLSKIESGCIDLEMEAVSLQGILEECIALTMPAADTRDIAIVHHAGDGECRVEADRTRLRQVLLNLLSNAVKYNCHGGRVDISSQRAGQRWLLAISDTGPGIPTQRREELFQPFRRLGAEDTDVEGTGIGLMITKQLVNMMGGRIRCEDRPGGGTTFIIELRPAQAMAVPRNQLA